MLVEEVMNTKVVTLPATAKITEALQLLQKHRIRHLPIVNDQDQVIGIVSDRDVRDASPSILDKNPDASQLESEITSIMSSPVITIHPLDFIEEIAYIFYNKEFAALPVVSNDKLVGIVTEKDMLSTFIQITGTNVPGSHLKIKVPHKPGVLPDVTAIFGERNINITSLLIFPYKKDSHYRTIVLRFQTMNPEPVIQDLRKKGYELLWPNHQMESPL